jgi:hypothetical protein
MRDLHMTAIEGLLNLKKRDPSPWQPDDVDDDEDDVEAVPSQPEIFAKLKSLVSGRNVQERAPGAGTPVVQGPVKKASKSKKEKQKQKQKAKQARKQRKAKKKR